MAMTWVIMIVVGLCLYGGAMSFLQERRLSKLEKEIRDVGILVSIESEKRRKMEAKIDETFVSEYGEN